nr:MAG TPA: hypothetical protein [Caudoviricetes sp.]
MAEYIEREATLREIERRERLMVGDKTISVDALKQFILNRPAADVAPVVHGRWVDGKCSNCGVDIPTDDSHDAIFENECHFCYYCGAMMDGGDRRCG